MSVRQFLEDLLPNPGDRKTLIKSLRRIFESKERKILIFTGDGGNGRSTLIGLIEKALGNEFGQVRLFDLCPEIDTRNFHWMSIFDKKLVYGFNINDDPDDDSLNQRLNCALKSIMTDQPIRINVLYGADIISQTQFSLLLTASHPPRLIKSLQHNTEIIKFPIKFVENPTRSNEKKMKHDILTETMVHQLIHLCCYSNLQYICIRALRTTDSLDKIPPHLKWLVEKEEAYSKLISI